MPFRNATICTEKTINFMCNHDCTSLWILLAVLCPQTSICHSICCPMLAHWSHDTLNQCWINTAATLIAQFKIDSMCNNYFHVTMSPSAAQCFCILNKYLLSWVHFYKSCISKWALHKLKITSCKHVLDHGNSYTESIQMAKTLKLECICKRLFLYKHNISAWTFMQNIYFFNCPQGERE